MPTWTFMYVVLSYSMKMNNNSKTIWFVLFLNPNVILETYLWSSLHFSQRYCGSTRLPRWTESTSWPSGQACEEQFGAVFTPSELKLAETYRWSKIRFLGFPITTILSWPRWAVVWLKLCIFETWISFYLFNIILAAPIRILLHCLCPASICFSDIYLSTFKTYLQSAALDLALSPSC